jgi:hypothetical protein
MVRIANVAAACILRNGSTAALGEDNGHFESGCKSGAPDKVYIALGPNVLAIRAKSNPPVASPLYPEAGHRALTPPDPSEPTGCFGNPRQLSNFGGPDYLMIALKPGPDGQWIGETSNLQTAKYLCDRSDTHEEFPEGVTACRIRLRSDPNPDHWSVTFIAHDDFYQTPLGHPFTVHCGPLPWAQCDVAYTYKYRLNLSFRYHFQSDPVSIREIVDRDREARDRIAAELVADYPWPDPTEEGGTAHSQ